MTEWISVKDVEPPKDRVFLAYILVGYPLIHLKDEREKYIQTCCWSNFHKNYCEACSCNTGDLEDIEILYWMELPKPPEE